MRERASVGSRLSRAGYLSACALIGLGGVAGLVFSLYRNDVLLGMARSGGWEPRYLALESRLLGTPGWGTPRSLSVELQSATPESGAERAAQPAAPPAAVPNAEPAAPVAAAPSAQPVGSAEAAGTSSARATSDGVKIVSLDALATLPAAQPAAARAPVPAPARRASENAAPARAPVERSAPAPVAKAPAAKAPVAKAPAPAPAAKAPAPAPAAKAPVAAPAANDNPLKAAIRSAIVKESQAK